MSARPRLRAVNASSRDADRVRAADDRQGSARYLDAIRQHWLLIATLVAVAVGAAALYSATAEKRYEASADLLVTPVEAGNETFIGIQSVLRESSQSRAVLTVARLIKTPEIVGAVRARLGETISRDSVDIRPQEQSNIVTIVGKAPRARRAADIANAFADELIAQRTRLFQEELSAVVRQLQGQLREIPPALQNSAQAAGIGARLAALQTLVGQNDPTLQTASRAVPPGGPSWPRPVLSIAVALLGALMLGIGIAVALELLNPRVNTEEELLLEQRLPILARVPRMPKNVVQGYLAGREPLPGDVREAYRTLRASLSAAGPDGGFPPTILVTSAIPGEAKTMTSVNLAITMALGGIRVILVDGDLRRPMVASVFGVAARQHGFASLLLGDVSPEDALVGAPGHGQQLRLLLASPEHAGLIDLLEPRRVERVVGELRLLADVVIIDSPPLTEVADALPLADAVDSVIVAARLGKTRRDKLNELRRMLAAHDVFPAGFVVTTRQRPRKGGYYYGAGEQQRRGEREADVREPALAHADGEREEF